MNIFEIPGHVDKDGRLIAENAMMLKRWLDSNKGNSLTITFQRFGNKRTTKQNRYYWGVVVKMIKERFKELGHELDSDEVHDFLKGEFNKREIVTENDHHLSIPRSTKDLDSQTFNEYIEKVRQFAAITLEINIPDPDENYQSVFQIS